MLMVKRIGLIVVGALLPTAAFAAILTSPHFRLDPNVANNFGGTTGSADYKLVDSGGEAVVGSGSSASYKLTSGYVGQLQKSIQVSVLPSGVAAYYALDTGTGIQAYDSSVNNNQGVLNNSPSWVTGKIGKALTFNGSNQYVNASNGSSVQLSTGTVEAWVKATTPGSSYAGIVVKQNAYSLYLKNGVLMTIDPNGAVDRSTGVSVADGAWHHVVMTFQSGVANGTVLYVDGQSKLTTTMTVSNQSSPLVMGATSTTPGDPLNGTIDEVKVYSRALSSTEVANAYTAGNAGVTSAVTIPSITPGASQTSALDAIVRTDAAGYTLGISENNNLVHTDGVTTIPSISGTIASPAAWTEGTTKGLGFTMTGGNSIESKWGTSPGYSYGAIPTSATTFHSRTGFLAGLPEKNSLQLREDVNNSQKSGTYSNTVTVTATYLP